MKIRLLAVGRIAPFLREAQEHYIRKIRNLELIEVKKGKSVEEEGKRLEEKIKGFLVILDERGKELTSREFSGLLLRNSYITFVVGGADGISENLKKRGNFILSLSKLTLQHDIARLVLLEQIYRGLEIIRGSPYHRD
ncbi:23S rRNA (pseudouridine1915-N3)-methyltransferase [Balnearium lithotrophicum]|uniref:Ribosomal RNA large subunit methyltransferase H n=1 Tax=Balnearium lithotrophicum TaxID=223788 RepID=A0A521DJC9_9BACT|nr:23S rRNA (pseudouridine(1915)-N(3))-methyltransferase RlmH [Balnearium lithotrophicum]SMO71695.1 23S rRNA (pseudouridine1915-N3)-methyltransferase [Balnearium lithotrophicum]